MNTDACRATPGRLDIQQDPHAQVVTIEGITYTMILFRKLGGLLPPGEWFQLVSREDGKLTLRSAPAGARMVTDDELFHVEHDPPPVSIARALREQRHGLFHVEQPAPRIVGSILNKPPNPAAQATIDPSARVATVGADIGDRDPDCTCDHPIHGLHTPDCVLHPTGLG